MMNTVWCEDLAGLSAETRSFRLASIRSRVTKVSTNRPYTSDIRSLISRPIDRMTKARQACRAPHPQKSLLLPVDFWPFMHRHIRDRCFHTHPPAQSIFTARGLQHNISRPAQRRDDAGADVGIIVRKHRGNASTRKNFPTAKLRCADINYPKACCGEGRAFNKHLILLRDK
jgi:hypothetical protein